MTRRQKTTDRSEGQSLVVYKCVRPDGSDFRTGTLNYAAALESGLAVEVLDAEPPTGRVCGHGIHVCDVLRCTFRFGDRQHRPWRWFEGEVAQADVVERDDEKLRVRRFRPTREVLLEEIFGPGFARRIEAARAEVASWASIPWARPAGAVSDDQIAELVAQWRDSLTKWLGGRRLPTAVRVIAAAAAAAAAAAEAAEQAAVDAAAAADDALWQWRFRWWRYYYLAPRYALMRRARWILADMAGQCPSAALIALYRLGCVPIGFVGGEFVVYRPARRS